MADCGKHEFSEIKEKNTTINMKFINLNSAVISMLPIPERKEILVGTYSHLVILDWDFEVFQKLETGRPVRAIAADKKGNIFIGMSSVQGDTLLKIDRNRNVQPISMSETLNILSLCVDKDDNLWIGTLGSGLLKFDGDSLEAYNPMNSDVNDDTIFSLCAEPTKNGKVWFGCKEHGLGLTNTWDEYKDKYGLSPTMLQMMLPEYGWKRYLVKTHHNPGGEYMDCNIFDKQVLREDYADTYQKEYQEDDYEEYDDYEEEMNEEPKKQIEFSGYVKCIGIDAENTLWLGTVNSGLIKFPRRGRNTVFHTDNSSIPDNDIYTLAVEANGVVWAGTDNGLVRIENEAFKIFNTNNSAVKCNEIRSLCIVNNHLLVGYNHSGNNPFSLLSGNNDKPGGISVFQISELK